MTYLKAPCRRVKCGVIQQHSRVQLVHFSSNWLWHFTDWKRVSAVQTLGVTNNKSSYCDHVWLHFVINWNKHLWYKLVKASLSSLDNLWQIFGFSGHTSLDWKKTTTPYLDLILKRTNPSMVRQFVVTVPFFPLIPFISLFKIILNLHLFNNQLLLKIRHDVIMWAESPFPMLSLENSTTLRESNCGVSLDVWWNSSIEY